jgi:cation diffusion facilitator family transporter
MSGMAKMETVDEAVSALSAAKRQVALSSVVAAACITVLKIATGIMTGSLGMLSEAAHSAIDLIAAAITLVSVRVSDMPADEDHTYGHGKIESLSAFVETVLMLGSCVWIVVEAVRRMMGHHIELKISIWPILVLLLSIVVDWTRSRQLYRVAREAHSQALEADALHFGTDIWSSAAVLVALGASFIGKHWEIQWLQYADPLAALVVSGIILRVTWRLASETVHALLDGTNPEMKREVVQAIEGVEGVLSVDRVRMRRSGAKYFADVTVEMPRTMSFQRTEQLVTAATEAVHAAIPEADVVIRTVPAATRRESVFDRVRAVAQRNNLSIHDVSVQEYENGLHVEQHLEVAAAMSLRTAHDLVTRIEAEMCKEVPDIASIATHIESEEAEIERPEALDASRLEADLREIAREFPDVLDVHDVIARRANDHVQMSCHCTMPDDLPMSQVHTLISELEARFRREHPNVARLLIHPEPATDNQR